MNSDSPLFFHIGLPKTATTTIQHVLKLDPRINLISTRYFNRFEFWEHPFQEIQSNRVNMVSEENQILQMLDFGKFNLFLSRIARFSPHAHIIITIREQRDLLESRYKYQFDWHGGYTKGFEQWLKSAQGMDYLSICMYHSLYKSIQAFFPPSQIHFLMFEDLRNDFSKFFTSLYAILNLTPASDFLNVPTVRNQSMPESQLSIIKKINRIKLFKADSKAAKCEFAFYQRLSGVFKTHGNRNEFRWNNISHKSEIEHDFAMENTGLVSSGILDIEKLRIYNYLTS